MPPDIEVVWLLEENTYAILVRLGAYTSRVKYLKDGAWVEDEVWNDDYEFWQERAIEYEQE